MSVEHSVELPIKFEGWVVANTAQIESPASCYRANLTTLPAPIAKIILLAVMFDMASLVGWFYVCAAFAFVDSMVKIDFFTISDWLRAEETENWFHISIPFIRCRSGGCGL